MADAFFFCIPLMMSPPSPSVISVPIPTSHEASTISTTASNSFLFKSNEMIVVLTTSPTVSAAPSNGPKLPTMSIHAYTGKESYGLSVSAVSTLTSSPTVSKAPSSVPRAPEVLIKASNPTSKPSRILSAGSEIKVLTASPTVSFAPSTSPITPTVLVEVSSPILHPYHTFTPTRVISPSPTISSISSIYLISSSTTNATEGLTSTAKYRGLAA